MLQVTYHKASDGPRLLFFGPLSADLAGLQQLFRDLRDGRGPVTLDQLSFLQAEPGLKILFCTVGDATNQNLGARVGLRQEMGERQSFVWCQSAAGWDDLAEQLEGLRNSTMAGHQYLNLDCGDDAIIVVSRGEYVEPLES